MPDRIFKQYVDLESAREQATEAARIMQEMADQDQAGAGPNELVPGLVEVCAALAQCVNHLVNELAEAQREPW